MALLSAGSIQSAGTSISAFCSVLKFCWRRDEGCLTWLMAGALIWAVDWHCLQWACWHAVPPLASVSPSPLIHVMRSPHCLAPRSKLHKHSFCRRKPNFHVTLKSEATALCTQFEFFFVLYIRLLVSAQLKARRAQLVHQLCWAVRFIADHCVINDSARVERNIETLLTSFHLSPTGSKKQLYLFILPSFYLYLVMN